MKHSENRILTSHTGSLAQPADLRQLLRSKASGEPVDQAELDSRVRETVVDVVRRQVDVGLSVINDGEQSKTGWSGYVMERLDGFGFVETSEPAPFGGFGGSREAHDYPEFFARNPLGGGTGRRRVCNAPIGWRDFAAVQTDIANLKGAVRGLPVEDVFMTAASPGVVARAPNHYYRSKEEYLQAISDAMKREYEAIANAGVVLQIDCPDLASRPGPYDFPLSAFRKEIAIAVEALNYATRDIDPGMMRIHVCWGSDERPHHLDPELKDIVDILLKARPAGMTIVGANGRHAHEWRVWRDVDVPAGKVIIAGVIDSTTHIIEHPEVVADRIVRYAGVLGRENIIAGVDCGFMTAGREHVDRHVAWAKLRSLAQGAELATRHLWNRG